MPPHGKSLHFILLFYWWVVNTQFLFQISTVFVIWQNKLEVGRKAIKINVKVGK